MDLSKLSCIILFIYLIISTGPCASAAALRALPAASGRRRGRRRSVGGPIITGAGTGTGAWRGTGTGRPAPGAGAGHDCRGLPAWPGDPRLGVREHARTDWTACPHAARKLQASYSRANLPRRRNGPSATAGPCPGPGELLAPNSRQSTNEM